MAINIKPSHKGRFTEYKKRTGKTTTEALHSKDPHVRQMANFARNAKKWKHEDGGLLGDPTKYNLNKKGAWSPVVWNGDMYDSMVRNGVISSDTLSRSQFSKYSLDQVTNLVNANPDFLRVQNGISSTNNWGKTFLAKDGNKKPTPIIPQPIYLGNTLQNYATDWQPGQQGSGNATKIGSPIYQNYATGGTLIDPLNMATDLGVNTIDAFATPDQYTGDQGYVDINEGAAAGKGALKGVAAGATLGSVVPVLGTVVGGIIGGIAGGVGGFFGASNKQRRMNSLNTTRLAKNQFNKDVNNRLSTMQPQQSYMPVAKQGGFTVYKGESHSGPNGGIFTDEQGNPTGLSNNQPIALTENNEVARFNPDTNSTYIYSDSLGFAKPATNLVNKYKLDKSTSEYKYNPLLKIAVDKQFDNLQQAQEFAKETKTSTKDAIGIFKNGGTLTKHKAEEMIKDGTAHGKKLTPKQRKYFQAVAHGMPSREEGGDLPTYGGDGPSWLDPNYYSNENLGNRRREDYSGKINQGIFGLESSSRLNDFGLGYQLPELNFSPLPKYIGSNPQLPTDINRVTAPSKVPINPLVPDQNLGLQKSSLTTPVNSNAESGQYNPTLSPLGHIASAVGSLADYSAMKKAKPTDVSLPRVGAERINLGAQRVANDRNAATSRAVNATSARGLGMNAGATFTNTNVANTGVNRLLGQQNAESLMNQENTNAQMRQQANMMNAELAAQEGLFNTQQSNAYRAQMAQMNPLGNLSRIAASYAKDNAAYRQNYNTLKMLAPNAEVYKPEDQKFLDWLVGGQPGVRLKDK